MNPLTEQAIEQIRSNPDFREQLLHKAYVVCQTLLYRNDRVDFCSDKAIGEQVSVLLAVASLMQAGINGIGDGVLEVGVTLGE